MSCWIYHSIFSFFPRNFWDAIIAEHFLGCLHFFMHSDSVYEKPISTSSDNGMHPVSDKGYCQSADVRI
jgi:hypothetical protein